MILKYVGTENRKKLITGNNYKVILERHSLNIPMLISYGEDIYSYGTVQYKILEDFFNDWEQIRI